jgi:drug/metabolite transporter (DMT)-like permease
MKDKAMIIGLLVISTLLGAVGQFFFKYSFADRGSFAALMLVGLLSYALSTVIYLFVLSRVHLSWAYSMGGISYVFAVLLAYIILMEKVPPLRWVGVLAIAVGVVLIGFS